MADRLYQRLGIIGRVIPQRFSTAATAASSGPIDMSTNDRALLILQVGAVTGTVNVEWQAATSTVASDFAAFSTPLQMTGVTSGSYEQEIELNASAVPNGKRYVRALITGSFSSTNTGDVSAVILGEPRYAPTPQITTVRTPIVG
jgi:hypothetical protein